ncbi:hypothetical protein [Paenibacillus vortex]|uniref:hypothetical protein n=1 Tax=Paenibacillus vortex TaxID=71995 RepID=UPI001F1A4B32|nr:hypothetical protein [Paenibacillus vortex]
MLALRNGGAQDAYPCTAVSLCLDPAEEDETIPDSKRLSRETRASQGAMILSAAIFVMN